jgi:hypothetical protein
MQRSSIGKILDAFYNEYPVSRNDHAALARAYIGRFVGSGGLKDMLDISHRQLSTTPLHLSLAGRSFDVSSLTKRASLVGEPLIVSSLRSTDSQGEYAYGESHDRINLHGISLEPSVGGWPPANLLCGKAN